MKQRTVISVALAFLFVLILASAKVRGAMHQAYYSSTNQSVVTDLLALHPGQNRKTDLARAIAKATLTDDRLTRQTVDPSSLVDYCITYPNDLLAHSLLARVALQPSSYSGNLPSWQKNVTLSLEASKRFGVLEPENWFWRLSECYAQLLLGNAGMAREVLLRSPAPSKYDDRKRACDVFLQDFSKGGFWGQSELARNSLVRGGQMDRYLQLTELRSNLVKEIPNQGEIDVLFAKIGCSQVQLKSFAGAFMGQQLICLSVQSKYGIIGDLEYEKEKAQEFRQFCGNFAERNSAALTTEERSIISQAWLSPQPVTKRVYDDLREL